MPNPTVDDNIKAYERAVDERRNFSEAWQQVAELVLPTRQFTAQLAPGQQRHNKIFNSTAPEACETLAAALDGLLTNTSIRWFELGLEDFDESVDEDAANWLFHCTTLMQAFLSSPESGFAMSSHEAYLDLCAFGTAVVQANESLTTGILRFRVRALANHYICENDDGEITDDYRDFEPRARDLAAMFPKGTFSDKVQGMLRDKVRQYDKVRMLHCVYPRSEYDASRQNRMNKRWASRYIEKDTKQIVWESGFDKMPYLCPRWSKAAEEAYGRSPAMNCLPTIKVVNAKEKTFLKAAEKAVDPPLWVPANGLEGAARTAPGSVMYGKPGGGAPQPMFLGVNLAAAEAVITRDEAAIQKAFYGDALQLPEIDRMTREEVITRRQQGLLKASPILSRLYVEKIGPEVAMTFNWMKRTGQLPPRPPSIQGRKLGVQYVSPMALSRRASEADNFTAAMATAAPLASVDPAAFRRNIDVNGSLRSIFRMHNNNPKFLRSKRAVALLEKAEQEAQSLAQTAAIAQTGAGAIRQGAAAVKDLTAAAPTI